MTRDEQVKLEAVRWELLRIMGVSGHVGATETMMVHTLKASWATIDREYIRNQLAYLESRKLIELERPPIQDWRGKLTRHGDDIFNYVVECEPGISRPPQYWS